MIRVDCLAVVTGVSSGIGAATVAKLTAAGMQVHALAPGEDSLAELASRTGCVPHVVDVSDTDAIEALLASCPIDVPVNNAGKNRPGGLRDASAADVEALIDVNLTSVLQLCRLILPGMLARDRGHTVNVGSIAGHHVFEGHTAYQVATALL